jgi:uncharacterized membrane protein
MPPEIRDMLDLVLRWIHLIAGIMWVGNSMLFNWLDRNLVKPDKMRPDVKPELLDGEIWMVHSGGFYQVEKKQLEPSQMPKTLHWFKWQAYTTWITGFLLLGVVYYHAAGMLVDVGSPISQGAAVGIGLGVLFGGYAIYDGLWRSPLGKMGLLPVVISFLLLGGAVWFLAHTFNGRAAYIHVGALLGSLMAGNVAMHIIPSQRELVKMTREGKLQDTALGKRAKTRSIHNNYMTFPVLFIMVSNHFPQTYGSHLNYAILGVLIISGALVRHIMNIRFWFKAWLPTLLAVIAVGVGATFFLVTRPAPAVASTLPSDNAKVSFTTVQLIVQQRCVQCHSEHPTDDTFKVAPNNIKFDDKKNIKMYSERIKVRAVIQKTMPNGNKTGMTQEEREVLAKWLMQGAPTDD